MWSEKSINTISFTTWIVAIITLLTLGVVAMTIETSMIDYAYDFRLLWLAGRTWSAGASPYDLAFNQLYGDIFGFQPDWHIFNYPPYFSLLSIPLSWMTFDFGFKVWTVANLLLIAASAHFLALVGDKNTHRYTWYFVAILLFAATNQGTKYTILVGQTAMVILLAASLFIYGYVNKKASPLVVSLILFSLKPNLGLIPGLVVLAQVFNFRTRKWQSWAVYPVVGAGVFVLVGTGLSMILGGLGTLGGFLERIRTYSQTEPCAPFNMTGPAYLFDTFLGISFPLVVTLVVAGLLAAGFAAKADSRLVAALGILATVFAFMPLHTYDLVVTVALVPLVWTLTPHRAGLAALGLIILHRCGDLEPGFNEQSWFAGMFTGTLAGLFMVLVCVGARDRFTSSSSTQQAATAIVS